MGEWSSNVIAQLRALPPARQALLGVTAAISLAFVFWLVTGAARPEYRVLYRGLEEQPGLFETRDTTAGQQIREETQMCRKTEGLDRQIARRWQALRLNPRR